MKLSRPAGLALVFTGLALAVASCSTTTAPSRTAAPDPVQAIATGTATARPEFPGFRLVVRKGEEFYCQKRNPTGSRARVVEVCFTHDQMRKMAENNQDFFNQLGASGSHDALRTDSPR
jgi:hypothetical protein